MSSLWPPCLLQKLFDQRYSRLNWNKKSSPDHVVPVLESILSSIRPRCRGLSQKWQISCKEKARFIKKSILSKVFLQSFIFFSKNVYWLYIIQHAWVTLILFPILHGKNTSLPPHSLIMEVAVATGFECRGKKTQTKRMVNTCVYRSFISFLAF